MASGQFYYLEDLKLSHSERMADAWTECKVFNDQNPIGTSVRYFETEGSEPIETVTRSEAWALESGHAVVSIEKKSGGVSLAHIEVI